jgi:hypothetical protein
MEAKQARKSPLDAVRFGSQLLEREATAFAAGTGGASNIPTGGASNIPTAATAVVDGGGGWGQVEGGGAEAERRRPKRAEILPVQYMVVRAYQPHTMSPYADVSEELTLAAKDVVTVFGAVGSDGYFVGVSAAGEKGLIPGRFLASMPTAATAAATTAAATTAAATAAAADLTAFPASAATPSSNGDIQPSPTAGSGADVTLRPPPPTAAAAVTVQERRTGSVDVEGANGSGDWAVVDQLSSDDEHDSGGSGSGSRRKSGISSTSSDSSSGGGDNEVQHGSNSQRQGSGLDVPALVGLFACVTVTSFLGHGTSQHVTLAGVCLRPAHFTLH